MRQRRFRSAVLTAGLTLLLGMTSTAAAQTATPLAQCATMCGDVNGTGSVTSADIIALSFYTHRADSQFVQDQRPCADLDDYEGITMRDLCVLLDFVFHRPAVVDCDLDNGSYLPIANSTYFLHHNSVFPPGDTVVRLDIDVTLPDPTMAVSIPLKILVGGEVPQFGEINEAVSEGYGWNLVSFGDSRTADIPEGYLMGGYVDFDPGVFVLGRHPLGTAELLMPAANHYRTITVELVEIPEGDNTPMAVQGNTRDGWALNLAPWIADPDGDVNNDQIVNAADIITLVNYTFKSGPVPYPVPAAGDVNCNGAVTSSDIISLVNFVFKSGNPPCDLEAECTINLEQWTCP